MTAPPQPHGSSPFRLALGVAVATALLLPAALSAQTLRGVLLDGDSDRPIPLGLVMLYSESGDSITATVTDADGRFSLAASAPGSFLLRAASLGYRESTAGIFDVGAASSMDVQFRLAPAPLPIDEIAVAIDRPILDHHLVRNGFVRRVQRGLGLFVTPYDIENSPARTTESLLEGMPSVRVGTVRVSQGGVGMPMPHLGETVQIRGPDMRWCDPDVYVDGVRAHYDPSIGINLTALAHIGDVEAVEVYRRPAEFPVEYPGPVQGSCGIVVMWTKLGLAAGQRPEWFGDDADAAAGREAATLPRVDRSGPPPVAGERIRVQLTEDDRAPGLTSPWAGEMITGGADALVARDPVTGRPLSIPYAAVEELQVSRTNPPSDAVRRGLIFGGVAALGSAGFLRLLCEATCQGGGGAHPVVVPSAVIGALVGFMVGAKGPGESWVSAPLPRGR